MDNVAGKRERVNEIFREVKKVSLPRLTSGDGNRDEFA